MIWLKKVAHHFTCDIVWAWPHIVQCDYVYCCNKEEK